MADHTADLDWVDCRALRAAQATVGERRRAAGLNVDNEAGPGRRAWQSALRLIEPEADRDATRAAAQAAARAEAEAFAARKAREQAKAEAEEQAQAKSRAEAQEKASREAEARRKAEADAKARAAAEAKAKAEAEQRASAEHEAHERAAAEARAKAEMEARATAEAEAKAEAAAKASAEEQVRRESEARAEREAREKAEAEAEERARLEAEAAAKAAAKQAAANEQAQLEAEVAARAQINVGQSLRRLIRETGPISLAHYMGESNARYYASRDPLGDQGDFITAPEVSQMFGELVGLWLADLWVRMGSRKHIHYVELGPGRGTLAKDALATAARYGFAPQVHFVETSATLRRLQRAAFPGCHHHHDLSTLPDDAPLLIVANEFFDALPIHQLLRSADGWFERMVGLNGDALTYIAGRERIESLVPPGWLRAAQGSMIETSPAAVAVMGEIAQRLTQQGGAALIIDYGQAELRAGSTVQAVKAHQKVDVFAYPGEADITAHVDFNLLQQVAAKHGADVMGLQMQGEWLRQMGIDTRLEALQRRNPREADKLRRQRDRLVEASQMGTLFKVLGICGRRWPFGVGFA